MSNEFATAVFDGLPGLAPLSVTQTTDLRFYAFCVRTLIHPLILYDLKNPAKRATFRNHVGEAFHKR